jgi:NAD(P)-dependent dehydrogenase (short-subunit alcohol dehydrogenase family)
VTNAATSGRLKGKVAIVTGAAPRGEGIGNGSAVATLFAREGATVVLVNRSADRARELQQNIERDGGRCSVYPADATDERSMHLMVVDTIERYGKLDILHNNVGFGGRARVEDMPEEEWDRVMNGNLKSVLWACKYAIPQMRQARGGSIITVSSIAGAVGLRDSKLGLVAYSTAKAGVIGLTRSVAAEYGREGIRANCIVVGMVDTPMLGTISDEVREKRRMAVPLQTSGTGWDVGWAAVYLASDESRWVTGIQIPIDAGQMRLFDRPG